MLFVFFFFNGREPSSFITSLLCNCVIVHSASFDELLWYDIGSAISSEARAMHDVGAAGLSYWAPNINLFVDPR